MFARLLLLFILVPLAELYLFLVLGSRIGVPATIAIIIVTGALGASLTRSQGLQTLERFKAATQEGRLPHEELLDGLMILIAGAVLLTPGFLTDVVGFLLLVPPVRAIVRTAVAKSLKGRIHVMGQGMGMPSDPTVSARYGSRPTAAGDADRGRNRGGGAVPPDVIDAEVIDAEVIEERRK